MKRQPHRRGIRLKPEIETAPPEVETLRLELPGDMQKAPRWLVWRAEPGTGDKPRKMPYYADGTRRSGKLDGPEDLARLVSFERGLEALATGRFSGIGFALGPDSTGNAWQGIDLDHTDTRPELAALVDLLPGYVERSPSGTGVHALGYGQPFASMGSNASGIEAYAAGRFFTVTGAAIGGDIADLSGFVSGTLAPLHRQASAPAPTHAHPCEAVSPETVADLRSALFSMRADDRHLWVRMAHHIKGGVGELGRGLWLDWSATSEKFDPADAARVWDSIDKPHSTDYRAVFAAAQAAGWLNPRSRPKTGKADSSSDRPDATEDARIWPYARIGCELYQLKLVSQGRRKDEGDSQEEIKIPLANFSAVVAEERQVDDGAEVDHRTLLRVARPSDSGPLETEVEIPTAQFPSLTWVTSKCGHRYVINAGQSSKDHVRAAIQVLSPNIQARRIYSHTGWRQLGGRFGYLHAAGMITADGQVKDIEVDLPDQLANYALPPPPDGERLKHAVRCSLRQMELIDDGLGAVQLARIYAPPLCAWYRLDLGVFAYGRTGCGKTEIAALAQSHYGAGFNARSLPGNWESTEGALLLKAFKAKDALFEVDDWNPQGNASDHLAMSRKADRLYRSQANGGGKDRLTPDIRLRTTHVPRGLVSSSGEDLPAGRSLRARMWILELSPKALRLDVLSECQGYAREGIFAEALAGYLRWVAGRADRLREALPARYEAHRSAAPDQLREHARIPANFAALLLGIDAFLGFALEVGALGKAEKSELFHRCVAGLQAQGAAQMDIQEESEDAVRFVELLRSAFATGRVFVADGDEREATRPPPTRAAQLGWRGYRHRHEEPNGETRDEIRYEAKGERIGYAVAGDLWLDPEATYTAVSKIAREQGSGALRTQRRMGKALVERGYIDKPAGPHIATKHYRDWISPSRVWRVPLMRIVGSAVDTGDSDV